MRHYDELSNNYVVFEKMGHRTVRSRRGATNRAKRARQLKRLAKIKQKRLDRSKVVRFRIVRITKQIPKPAPKPVGPKYDGTLISIGKILKFYRRREMKENGYE